MPRQPAPPIVAPSLDDEFVAVASQPVGGPLGRHARLTRSRAGALTVVLIVTAITLVLGFVEKQKCLTPDGWANQHQYTHMCYSDIVPLFGGQGLSEGKVPYRDQAVEYPVLTGGVMWLAADVARETAPEDASRRFYLIHVLILGLCALVLVATTFRLAGRRVWDALMVAASPVVAVYAFYNWDMLAAAFLGAGMEAWRRRRPALTGALLGMGASAKLYPAFLLVALLPLCLRAGRMRAWLTASAAGVAAWAAINVPIALAYRENWSWFYRFSSQRSAGWHDDSIWYQINRLTENSTAGIGKTLHDLVIPPLAEGESPSALNSLTLVLLIVVWSAILLLAWRAPRRPRVAQVAFLIVVAFLFANKVWSPQYALWYVPLGVLALPRWRTFVVWQLSELLVFATVMLSIITLVDPAAGLDYRWFFLAVWLRNFVLFYMAGAIIRHMWRPDLDPVRRTGDDDPAGGVLDGAPDRADALPDVPARAPAYGAA
jgi:uncharacterized membrane protein